MKTLTKLIIGTSLAALATPASAAQWISLNSGGTVSGQGRTFTDGTVNVRATGWSIDSATRVQQASLGYYSDGLGVSYGRDNSHTVDNWGTLDFLLLQFDRAVTLDRANFVSGWHSMNDTDALIGYASLAQPYTSQPGYHNQLAATALSAFSIFASGSSGNSGDSNRAINPMAFSGNTWIVAADAFASDLYADGFKLKAVSYSVQTPAVPEPATWAMLLIGFGAVGGIMRSRPVRTRVRYA